MKFIRKFLVLMLLLSTIMACGVTSFANEVDDTKIWTDQGGISVEISKGKSVKGFLGGGIVDTDFYLKQIPGSNTYLLYYNVKSTNLINGFIGQVKVKSTSILFPETYLSESVNDGFPATNAEYGRYIGHFTVPSGTEKVRISIDGWKVYDLSEASWLSFGSWSGTFSL